MESRTFRSPEGRRWRVYHIEPSQQALAERRGAEDRRRGADEAGEPPLIERRRTPERRAGATSPRRTGLPGVWRDGWLLFEPAEGEADDSTARRRLAPVPDGWQTCSDAQLAVFRDSAEEVRTRDAGAATDPAARPEGHLFR